MKKIIQDQKVHDIDINKHDIMAALQDEIFKHPRLCEQLASQYDENKGDVSLGQKFATIAAYCEIKLDGTYRVGDLAEMCYKRLKLASDMISLNSNKFNRRHSDNVVNINAGKKIIH